MATRTLVVGKYYCVSALQPHHVVSGPFDTEAAATASMSQAAPGAASATSDTLNVMVAKTAAWGC